MPLFGCRKTENCVEPGPNPFKPPMILNIHIKYDERIQTLDVLVRNLENAPIGEKVKVEGKFVERNAYEKRKKPGFIDRIMHRDKTDAEGYPINSHSTPAKSGPNPHYNTKFPFGDLIRTDVQCGKLVFEIFETSLTKSKFLGCVEMEGSEIKIDRDTAYSLYVRDPNFNPPVSVVQNAPGVCTKRTVSSSSSTTSGKQMVCYPTNNVVCEQDQNCEVQCNREFECFQERGSSYTSSTSSSSRNDNADGSGKVICEIVTRNGRMRGYSTSSDSNSTATSSSSSSSSSASCDDSEITIYEIVHIDPHKVTKQRESKQHKAEACEVMAIDVTDGGCCDQSPACLVNTIPTQQSAMPVCPVECGKETTYNQEVTIGDHESAIDENATMLHSNIQYNDRRQKLTVFIRNLGIVDDRLRHFVKCVLYTADGRRLERSTSSKYGINPYFNQELVFSKLVQSDIRGGHLLFTVNEKKKFRKNVIGMGIIPGSRINLSRDEAYNIAIVQQYCSKIAQKFTYNPKDVTSEPDNLIRVVYPESQKHIEVYK